MLENLCSVLNGLAFLEQIGKQNLSEFSEIYERSVMLLGAIQIIRDILGGGPRGGRHSVTLTLLTFWNIVFSVFGSAKFLLMARWGFLKILSL